MSWTASMQSVCDIKKGQFAQLKKNVSLERKVFIHVHVLYFMC